MIVHLNKQLYYIFSRTKYSKVQGGFIDPNKLWDSKNKEYRLPVRGMDFDPFGLPADIEDAEFKDNVFTDGIFNTIGDHYFIAYSIAPRDHNLTLEKKYITKDYIFDFAVANCAETSNQLHAFIKDGLDGIIAFTDFRMSMVEIWQMDIEDFHKHFEGETSESNPNLWKRIYQDYKVTDVKHFTLDEMPIFNFENFNTAVPFDER